jgi:hypothetical protein
MPSDADDQAFVTPFHAASKRSESWDSKTHPFPDETAISMIRGPELELAASGSRLEAMLRPGKRVPIDPDCDGPINP